MLIRGMEETHTDFVSFTWHGRVNLRTRKVSPKSNSVATRSSCQLQRKFSRIKSVTCRPGILMMKGFEGHLIVTDTQR